MIFRFKLNKCLFVNLLVIHQYLNFELILQIAYQLKYLISLKLNMNFKG